MTQHPSKTRHYPKVNALVNETSQDISLHGKQKTALSILLMDWLIETPPPSPSLISSAHGRILDLLLCLPAYALENPQENPLWERMRHLMLALPAHTHFTLATHRRTNNLLANLLQEANLTRRCRILAVDNQIDFTIWAQDPIAVGKDSQSGDHYILEPHTFLRSGDAYLADLLASAVGYRHTQAPLYFEGGNILVADDFFFLGADYPVETIQYIGDMVTLQPGETRAQAVKKLFQQYLDKRRKLLVLGSTVPIPEQETRTFQKDGKEWKEHYYMKNEEGSVQPLFHIDMFVSLAGRDAQGQYQLLVGDPRLAADLLGEPLPRHAMVNVFDNVARNLQKAGFKVYRNPLPLTYVDDEEECERKWYFATANNALVEIVSDQEKRVWLPSYGCGAWENLKKTDEANQRLWESLGFEVQLLPDFHTFAEHSGAVHCITKYLKRG